MSDKKSRLKKLYSDSEDMSEKVSRVAFLYLEPKSRDDIEMFAQCGSCRMFVPEVEGQEGSRCVIHGSRVVVDEDDSCGFFVDWPTDDGKPNPKVVEDHSKELAKGIAGSVTPEESGLVDDMVQCHRCVFAKKEATICGLYQELNRVSSNFDLNVNIKPDACCNAWTESEKEPE